MNKYNIEELAEKLERCRNVNLDDVKLESVYKIAEDCLTNILKNL